MWASEEKSPGSWLLQVGNALVQNREARKALREYVHTAVRSRSHLHCAAAVTNNTHSLVSEFKGRIPCGCVCLVLELFESRNAWPFPVARIM